MKTSPKGKAFIASFEDDRLKAYPDPLTGGAPWTIGKGHTGPEVRPGLVWTQAQSDAAFERDLDVKGEFYANNAVRVPLTQGQFDALVSIIFNVGPGSPNKSGIIRLKDGSPSTLLRKLNAGDYDGARDEFEKWVSPGTPVENGLRRRRKAEVELLWTSQESDQ